MALGVWRKYSRGETHGVEFLFMKQKTLFPAHFAPGRGANGFMKSTPYLLAKFQAQKAEFNLSHRLHLHYLG